MAGFTAEHALTLLQHSLRITAPEGTAGQQLQRRSIRRVGRPDLREHVFSSGNVSVCDQSLETQQSLFTAEPRTGARRFQRTQRSWKVPIRVLRSCPRGQAAQLVL